MNAHLLSLLNTPRLAAPSSVVSNYGETTTTTSNSSNLPGPAQAGAGSTTNRRDLLLGPAVLATAYAAACSPANASALPESVDNAWERVGGGPADLVFPDEFEGEWVVDSVLTNIELPLGPEFVPDMKVVQRASTEDKNKIVRYHISFIKNARGQVVFDRRLNMAYLMNTYLGMEVPAAAQRIKWDIGNPNQLQMNLPGDLFISTRVTRRSEEQLDNNRIETSEFYQQVIENPEQAQPKIKASQTFTKYKWRSPEQAQQDDNGPQIVASQVVSDYLTAYDDPSKLMMSQGKPVTIYSYRISFRKVT